MIKYRFDGTTFIDPIELDTGENSIPSNIIFLDDNKAYVVLLGTGELLVFDPSDMSSGGRIDLSSYALGDGDTNPEPSSGVIRDGKLYLALAQIDNLVTWKCQAGASVLIIDIVTDMVEKHIQDDRACLSGPVEPSHGLVLDELGDIYVNQQGSFGFYPGLVAGYLRIKNGTDEFDPDYFFNLSALNLPGVPGEATSNSYHDIYDRDGLLYTNLAIPALVSNPPDFVNDKNLMPYRLDLRNQTATALDMPATVNWAGEVMKYGDKIVFGMLTATGTGLFSYDPSSGTDIGDQQPFITTEGSPVWIANY